MERVTGDSSGGLNESTIQRKENPETGLVVSGLNFSEKRRPDSNRGIADLQSAALPLGYGAFSSKEYRTGRSSLGQVRHLDIFVRLAGFSISSGQIRLKSDLPEGLESQEVTEIRLG